MIAKDLLRALRAHKGMIMVEVSNGTDSHIVQGLKVDLLGFIKDTFQPTQETGYTLYKGTFGRDYT